MQHSSKTETRITSQVFAGQRQKYPLSDNQYLCTPFAAKESGAVESAVWFPVEPAAS